MTIPESNDERLTERLRAYVGRPVSEFIKHRGPMLLLDTLIDIRANYAACEWATGESVFLEPGRGVPSYVAIEHMAQCIAVLSGARARLRGKPPPLGFLLGTRHFRTTIEYFLPGHKYVAECSEIVRDARGMAAFACEVSGNDISVATCSLSVLEHTE